MSKFSCIQLGLTQSSKNAQLLALCALINTYYFKVLIFGVACYMALANQHTYILKRSRRAPAAFTEKVAEPWLCFTIGRFCIRRETFPGSGVRAIEEACSVLKFTSFSPLGKDERFSHFFIYHIMHS